MASEVVLQHEVDVDDPDARPFLTIQGLRKTYGAVTAADITRLEARRGQLLTLLGPSGCGKTTTLRCIAGLIQADAGSIFIGGRDITALPTHRRNLGMVFQNYAIFPHMNVYENVAYGLQDRGLSRGKIRARVEEALSLVELTGYEQRYRHQLSGGQQQRVALARAVAYQPDVLLLDEPFSNLDAKLRKTMRLQVRQLQQRLRLTTVFVTHDQQEALSMSDVVAVINRGRVEQVGTPAEGVPGTALRIRRRLHRLPTNLLLRVVGRLRSRRSTRGGRGRRRRDPAYQAHPTPRRRCSGQGAV